MRDQSCRTRSSGQVIQEPSIIQRDGANQLVTDQRDQHHAEQRLTAISAAPDCTRKFSRSLPRLWFESIPAPSVTDVRQRTDDRKPDINTVRYGVSNK